MFYGIAGPGVRAVFRDWKRVEDIAAIIPYCSYRKFDTESAAWDFVNRHGKKEFTGHLYKYGDTFDAPYLTLRYLIHDNTAYYSINTKHFGNIRIDEPAQYRAHLVLVKKKFERLNPDNIQDNVDVIVGGVQLFAPFIDIDIIVPDHSIFYACTSYNGNDSRIKAAQEYLNNRIARVSYTMEMSKDGKHKSSPGSNASGRKANGRKAEG